MQAEQFQQYQHYFFIGVGGAGMSAIAQYLSGIGKKVSGSDRLFQYLENDALKKQLEDEGIDCFLQDTSGIHQGLDAIVISTAIEADNPELLKAKSFDIPVILRADLLAAICLSKRTIAVAGTSGKSTTTAMLFHILHQNGIGASLISGAGLVSLQQAGKIGNAYVGDGDWLVIEADESDGTLVKYEPEIGLLLSIDKDHKELTELHEIFSTFKGHVKKHFVVNMDHPLASAYAEKEGVNYGRGTSFEGKYFQQQGFQIQFEIQGELCAIPTIGQHNMENALACMAVASILGVSVKDCCQSLRDYAGIYRRHQRLGEYAGIQVIDDYAHNPAKIAASIRACQPVGQRLIAWFQPHGYGPTRFIRNELVEEISKTLRANDQIWMSEIYYAGGTAVKDISAADLIEDLKLRGLNAGFVADRDELFDIIIPQLRAGDVLLLMGARDPGLEKFGKNIAQRIKDFVSQNHASNELKNITE